MGEFRSEGTWTHPVRTIDSYEIILVLEGHVSLREENKNFILHSGDLLVLSPGKEHGGTEASTEKVAFYWFHFYTNLPVLAKYCRLDDTYQLRQLMKRLLHVSNTPGSCTWESDAVGYLLYEQLHRQIRGTDLPGTQLLEQVKEYIRIHVQKRLTVQMIAEHIGYHPDYLGKLFQKHFHVKLKEYLCTQRLKYMKNQLLTTDKTVQQIAYETGYGDENRFTKFFQYHEKIAPSEFRRQYCKTHLNNR